MIQIEHYKKMMVLGHILQMMLAYHMDKVSRKYDYLINILGADHAGYIKRITCSC